MFSRFLFPLAALGFLCSPASANSPDFKPANSRLPVKPAWELDVTERLTLESGQKYAEVMSRAARQNRVRGGLLKWNLTLQVAPNQAGFPLALEADEARVISRVMLDGKSASFDRRDGGDLWNSGEGATLVPISPQKLSCRIELTSADLPQAYENGFGRLRLRPATLNEIVRFSREGDSGAVRAVNRSNSPISVTTRVLFEDYFGAPLAQNKQILRLAANSEAPVALPKFDNGADALYKTRVWGESGGRKTYEYHNNTNGRRITRSRPQVLKLESNWERVFVPGPTSENPPPAMGWIAGGLRIEDKDISSHYMWARQRFTIPANWPTTGRVQMLIPNWIGLQAGVYIDGQKIGEAAGWDLPKRFVLPAGLKPGTTHTLELGITSYIMALAPGVAVPPPGAWNAGNRQFAGTTSATGAMRIGVGTAPEFSPIPNARTTNVSIVPRLAGGKTLEVRAMLESDIALPGGRARVRVFERGKPVFDVGETALSFSNASPQNPATTEISLQKAWPAAKLWDLENPHLYEVRTEILDGTGQIVDTRRDRFGFREFGTRGAYFTLNGEILKMHGGSHQFTTALLWPARPSTYRILRHQAFAPGETGGGQTQGIISLNAADELGYLLKGDAGNVNSHGADNYDWQQPIMWQRLEAGMKSVIEAYRNHPSMFMWDIGNEISFRGPGESERMGQLFGVLRRYDPTRLITVSGSNPLVIGAEVVNYHGWGTWENRTDYFFYRPEERPSYLKNAGYFQHKPANEPADKWQLDLLLSSNWLQLYPGYAQTLRHVGGKPAMFAEGMYQGGIETLPMFGNDAFLSLPIAPDKRDGFENSWRDLNVLGGRRLALQNVRQAGFASAMIHINGGTGRAMHPVASFSWDRKFRFQSGARMRTKFGVHNDLSRATPLTARYRLFDGEKIIGQKSRNLAIKAGEISFIDLDFALPATTTDRELRLEVRVWPRGGDGWFYDDLPITVYAPAPLQLPATQRLAVFDPKSHLAPHLTGAKVPFQPLAKLGDWNSQNSVLLVGSEGLNSTSSPELAGLAPKIQSGGRAVVLDHFSLPSFLPRPLVQSREMLSFNAVIDGDSPVTRGLLTEDLRAWQTRERDQIVSWNALEVPSSGAFLVHVTTVERAPVLEVGQGAGRVLFVQLNLKDALGVEPAASKVLGNILGWTASPSPFSAPPKSASVSLVSTAISNPVAASIVAGDEKLASGLQNRAGVIAPVSENLGAKLLVASGTSPATLGNLDKQRAQLKTNLENGGTLFFYGLDENGAKWLADFTGAEVKIEAFPHRYAYLTQRNAPLLAGLGHSDFWIAGLGRGLDPNRALNTTNGTTGNFVLTGPNVQTLTRPAYVSEIPVGRGKIVVNLVRSLENPVPSQMRILSVLLSNAGAHLDPDGGGPSQSVAWKYAPLDLSGHVNWSLTDTDDPNGKRGYNMTGADDDLRDFPTGRVNLRGVDYSVTPGQNNLILIAGKNSKLAGAASEIKGIQVRQKAERLYFLHNAAWGVPGFIYRVYYTEDRKAWIPGQPDPFVDVVVKPDENITEWVYGGEVESSKRFLAGASVAWVGGNKRTREAYQGGDKWLGVYQMAWDNPRPNDEIESIDIISPQTVGNGNAFIFGITAASRDESAAASAPKTDLAKVLAGADAGAVLEQVQFPNYGFVLNKDGTVASIYDSKGEPFARSMAWRATTSGGTPRQSEPFAVQSAEGIKIENSGAGNRRVWNFSGTGNVDWRASVIATPGRLRYELKYTPKTPLKPDWNAGLSAGLQFINEAQASVSVNENPLPIRTKNGDAIYAFDNRYTRWVYSYSVSRGNFNFVSPPRDGAPWTTGREESLWWEITPP